MSGSARTLVEKATQKNILRKERFNRNDLGSFNCLSTSTKRRITERAWLNGWRSIAIRAGMGYGGGFNILFVRDRTYSSNFPNYIGEANIKRIKRVKSD